VDVAERVKFSVRQVEALEADDAAHLPQGTFLRGFVRSYARVLHLDESALLGILPSVRNCIQILPRRHRLATCSRPPNRRDAECLFVARALAVALVLASFVWSHRESPKPETIVLEEVRLPDMTAASAPVVAVSEVIAASAVQPIVAPAKHVEPVVTTVTKTQGGCTCASDCTGCCTAGVGQAGGGSGAIEEAPIHIVFSEEAWMEITDTNGDVLLSRMNPAGQRKMDRGRAACTLSSRHRKASAVRIYYKGREVDLSQHKQTGLVRLVLE